MGWRTEIEFVTVDLPWAIADKDYSPPALEVQVSGACPLGGVGYTIVGGQLPPGIQFARLGQFSGVPRRSGSFEISVRASDGGGWTEKRFAIVVTGAPIFSLKPDKLEFKWVLGEPPPPEQVLHVSATWPRLAYQVVTGNGDWLKATPERGYTPRETSALDEDQVHVRVDGSHLKPGRYSTTLTVSAWQTPAVPHVVVELTVTAK